MKIIPNKIYKPLFTKSPRYFICMGGRASGRSYSASQFALLKLLSSNYFRCAIMRFVLGDIRNSIYQEIRDRIEESKIEDLVKIRENSLSFEFNGNKINGIGFRKSSGDQKSKLKSLASYNVVIIEEADEVAEEDFMQLDDSLRTTKSDIIVILLLNPPFRNHWIIKRWFNLIPSGIDGYYEAELKESEKKDTIYIHGSYLQNIKNLNVKTIARYESYKTKNPEHYYNMIKGLVSEGMRGRIYKKWKTIPANKYEELPYDEYYGLDFGFSNDETALVGLKDHNDRIYTRELLYETGLTNPMICKKLDALGIPKDAVIYADNAEPKSIEEIKRYGYYNIKPCVKGADSIRAGIDYLISRKVFYTDDSENLKNENQEYKWALNREKEPTNVPVDKFNHLMDAIRYGEFTKHQPKGFIGFA